MLQQRAWRAPCLADMRFPSLKAEMNLSMLSSMWRRRAEAEPVVAAFEAAAATVALPLVETKASDTRRFIARQTIFDLERKVYGYELLFRSGWDNYFSGDAEEATRLMIADGALYGFHEVTHGAPSFVNCTRESLVSGLVTLLPNSTVLEILETVVADTEVLEACARYKALGYKLALDDFQLGEGMGGLVELADYLKVDFRLSDAAARAEILAMAKGRKLLLLAEKVETEQEFQTAVEEGFTLFQGYFFCRPTVFSKKLMPSNGANYLYLLSALSQGDIHVAQLALLLKSEVALSFQLMRLVNTASFNVGREVRSLRDALMLVGETQFRKLILNAIATESCRGRSPELLVHILHRARFLELAAPFTGEDPSEQYLFGLLSLMDVMLGVPVADLIDTLPLRPAIKAALTGEHNQVSTALRLFERYRDADWQYCMDKSVALHIGEGELSELYRASLLWAENCVYAAQPKAVAQSKEVSVH